MAQSTPSWMWKIFTIFLSITPRGDYGHPGTRRPTSKAHALPLRPEPTHRQSRSSRAVATSRVAVIPSVITSVVPSVVASPVNNTVSHVSSTSLESSTTTLRSSEIPPSSAALPASTAAPIPQQQCPDGSSWFMFEDAMDSMIQDNWDLDAANHAKIGFDDGMQMTLNQSALYVTLSSKHSWLPPVTVEAHIKATGAGGIPSTLTMKGVGDTGAEIDLELVTYQMHDHPKPTYTMQLPVWQPLGERAVVLKKDGSELAATTSNECFEDKANPAMTQWSYTYPSYDNRAWIAYKLEWFPDQIKWYTEGLERVSLENKKASSYPSTPLPLKIGPWAVSKDSSPVVTWAGAVDWEANPNPSMSLKNVRITGCRAD